MYCPTCPPASYNIIMDGLDNRGTPYIVEHDCSNNAIFGNNYCTHILSREPTGFPKDLLDSIVKTTTDMGLNPLNRPVNITRQEGCW